MLYHCKYQQIYW